MIVDQAVIDACKRRDPAAQQVLYEKYAPIMLGICLRYISNRQEAEDVMQEGFLTVFNKIDQYADKGSFEGWMKRVFITSALMFIRKTKNVKAKTTQADEWIDNLPDEVDEEIDVESLSPKERIEQTDFSREELLEVISELPDGFKTVFNLSVFENYKHKEIADLLGISESTSKTQLLRARKLIQKKLFDRVVEKDKKNKKEKVLVLPILLMSGDFDYIDKMFQSGLGDMQVPPNTTWSAMSSKLAESQLAQSSGAAQSANSAQSAGSSAQTTAGLNSGSNVLAELGSKVAHFVTTHVQTTIIASVATVSTVGLVITTTNSDDEVSTDKSVSVEEIQPAVDDQTPTADFKEELQNMNNEVQATAEPTSSEEQLNADQPSVEEQVIDTVRIIEHKKIVVPKTIRKTITKKKVIEVPAENR